VGEGDGLGDSDGDGLGDGDVEDGLSIRSSDLSVSITMSGGSLCTGTCRLTIGSAPGSELSLTAGVTRRLQ